jgi:hypothetical protein
MVPNRACAPCSKLYCYEQWLCEDVRIEGTESLALHNLYRYRATAIVNLRISPDRAWIRAEAL